MTFMGTPTTSTREALTMSMDTYWNALNDRERLYIEHALSVLHTDCAFDGLHLVGDDRSGRAAEALARYIVECKTEA